MTPQLSEVKIYLTDEQMEKLERLKGLLAHSHPEMSLAELVSYLSDLGLKKLDPSQKEGRGGSAQNESVRQASVSTTRFVWKRDQGQCAWLHPQTGRRCTSRYRLQRDHRIPWAKGGRTTRENLRLLCFHHNQLEAEREFGVRIS